MKILVTGANGMVGNAVQKLFNNHKLILTDKDTMDVTKYHQVMAYKNIDLIIHLAAETDLEKCERDPAHAYITNSLGCYNMRELAKKLLVPIVYISTAGIFDGKKNKPYTDSNKPNPINHYGRSKWLGELLITAYPKHWVFRSGWMMGGGQGIDKKFVNKFWKKVLSGEKKIKVCDDCIGSPTYTMDLVKNIKKFIDVNLPYGIFHCAGEGSVSRFDVASEISAIKGLKVKLIPVRSSGVKEEFPCKRSKNEVLENHPLIEMRDWRVALKEYLYAEFGTKGCLPVR